MKILRNSLWVLILLLVAFLTFDWYRKDVEIAEAPYGVPFTLVDQTGAPRDETALRGRPTALFFGFTHCPEVCPTTLYELDDWLRQIDPAGDRIGAFLVTVDPERDTPAVMKDYVSSISDRIVGLSGDPEKVAAMVKGFHVYANKVPLDPENPDGDYTMDHTASIFLLDAKGRFKSTIAWGENPETAVEKLRNLIDS